MMKKKTKNKKNQNKTKHLVHFVVAVSANRIIGIFYQYFLHHKRNVTFSSLFRHDVSDCCCLGRSFIQRESQSEGAGGKIPYKNSRKWGKINYIY